MSKSTPIRKDGNFGSLYTEPHNIRAVIAAYMAAYQVDYKTAWAAWFEWAIKG